MYRYNIRLLSIFSFLVEFGLYTPVAIIYFSRVSGSYALGASILGIAMLAAAVFEVPTGVWSDKVGRRNTVILGSWAKVIAVICYAIGLSYWWLVAGAVLEGLARAFYSGNNDALLHDTLSDAGLSHEYHSYLGKISSMEHFAVAIGSLIGGIVATFSFAWLFWLSVIPQIYKLYISYQLAEPRSRTVRSSNIYQHTRDALKLFLKNPRLRLLSISDVISEATGEVTYQFRSAFFQSIWPLWAIGSLSSVVNFLSGMSFYLSGRMIKKWGAEKLLLVRSIYSRGISLVAYGFPTVYSPLLLATPSVLYGAGQVAKNSLMQREFSDHQRATMSSLNSLASSLAFGLMSIIIGMIADRLTPATAILIFHIVSIPIIFVYWKIFARRNS